jgi:16S rRNA (guanine(966)-N(2))-methyltransferase RsmD
MAREPKASDDEQEIHLPRIVGGTLRGRKLTYNGDLRTRPMKDRTREAVFNLVGTRVVGSHAIDLFAGTGALGLEALSRGAARATFIEQHFPTADLIKQHLKQFEITVPCQVEPGNTFIWAKRKYDLGEQPWVVFCCPPYAFYVDRKAEMLELIESLVERAPVGSVFVVEADERFDFSELPRAKAWDLRTYWPATVGFLYL